MRTLKQLLAGASLGLALLACGDPTGSAADSSSAVSVAGVETQSANAGEPELISLRPGAPPLASTKASFWAVQGRSTSVVIQYRASMASGGGLPFLEFSVPANTQLVDPAGRRLARGDSILIEVHVVPGQLAARFSPAGLAFVGRASAQLAIDYQQGALPVNPARQLAIWYLPCDGGAWEQQRSRLDRRRTMVVASISHFANYSVAY
ncbi:MAG: hypothetical protein OEW72_09855, partial [Gammaproteobacteria bacterium]|nr:hypothetical protein [Gammaproteobacteria bacterium]